MRHKIYRVLNEEYTDMEGNSIPHITYYKPEPGEPVNDGGDATLEELVELCDQDAESRNAHDFCGSHRLLGGLLHRHLGRAKATEVMLDIARYGGQHGMGGVCSKGNAYADLKVGKAGTDWSGTYPA